MLGINIKKLGRTLSKQKNLGKIHSKLCEQFYGLFCYMRYHKCYKEKGEEVKFSNLVKSTLRKLCAYLKFYTHPNIVWVTLNIFG